MRRFAIALSFPGEHRHLVLDVARLLAETLGHDRIFFDEWYEDELVGSGAPEKLAKIYGEESDVVVPFFSKRYEKPWCKVGWRRFGPFSRSDKRTTP